MTKKIFYSYKEANISFFKLIFSYKTIMPVKIEVSTETDFDYEPDYNEFKSLNEAYKTLFQEWDKINFNHLLKEISSYRIYWHKKKNMFEYLKSNSSLLIGVIFSFFYFHLIKLRIKQLKNDLQKNNPELLI